MSAERGNESRAPETGTSCAGARSQESGGVPEDGDKCAQGDLQPQELLAVIEEVLDEEAPSPNKVLAHETTE